MGQVMFLSFYFCFKQIKRSQLPQLKGNENNNLALYKFELSHTLRSQIFEFAAVALMAVTIITISPLPAATSSYQHHVLRTRLALSYSSTQPLTPVKVRPHHLVTNLGLATFHSVEVSITICTSSRVALSLNHQILTKVSTVDPFSIVRALLCAAKVGIVVQLAAFHTMNCAS